MTEIHLDPVGGVAGDMFVAALLDLRPELEAELKHTLATCPLLAGVEIELTPHHDGILTGRRFLVRRDEAATHAVRAPHDDHHDHDGHQHGHGPSAAGHDDAAHHDHVDWHVIRQALAQLDLDAETIRHATAIFAGLADAEARVHGTTPDEVRFHEVGAWDSVADILAAAWLIARIGATRWTIGALPLGGGRVRTAHGLLPVPAPATALLMQGFATIDDGVSGERVTPTGAAIVRHLCEPGRSRPAERILVGSAHGFGTRHLPGISNCLRLLAFEPAHASAVDAPARVAVLECEVDDQTSEDLALAIEALRAHPAVLDVVQAPVFGKKGRMMTHVRVLAETGGEDDVVGVMFEETTTIGVRRSVVGRSVLERRAESVDLGSRTLRVKTVVRPSGRTAKVEADDLAALGSQSARDRHRRAAEAAANTLDDTP